MVGGLCRNPAHAGSTQDACEACADYRGAPRGAGDLVHDGLRAIGVHAVIGDCGGCQRRREALNRLLPLADEPTQET